MRTVKDVDATLLMVSVLSIGYIDKAWLERSVYYVDRVMEFLNHVHLILGFVLPFLAIILLIFIVFLLIKQSFSKKAKKR